MGHACSGIQLDIKKISQDHLHIAETNNAKWCSTNAGKIFGGYRDHDGVSGSLEPITQETAIVIVSTGNTCSEMDGEKELT